MASQWRSCWIRISHISAAAVILHIIIVSDSVCSEAIPNEVLSDEGAIIFSTSPTPATVGRVGYRDYGRLQNDRDDFEKHAGSETQTFPLNSESDRIKYRKFYGEGVSMSAIRNLVLLPPKFKDLEVREDSNVLEQLTSGIDSNGLYRKIKIQPSSGKVRRITERASVYFDDVDMTDTSHDERIPDRNGEQVSTGNHTNNVDVLVRNKTSQGPKRSPKFASVDPRNSSALYKKARNLFHVDSDPPFGTKLGEENGTEGWSVEKAPAASVDQGLDAAIVTAISLGAVVCVSLLGAVGLVLYRRRSMSPKPQTLSDKCSNPDSSAYIEESSDDSEEMYSLDNDSFLNSLEAMTIQNLWTDNVKHTKL